MLLPEVLPRQLPETSNPGGSIGAETPVVVIIGIIIVASIFSVLASMIHWIYDKRFPIVSKNLRILGKDKYTSDQATGIAVNVRHLGTGEILSLFVDSNLADQLVVTKDYKLLVKNNWITGIEKEQG